jgi:hypothetical protein
LDERSRRAAPAIQAARGTRWVWALTFASAIEAIAKMLIPKDAKPTQTEAKALARW